MLSDLDLGQEMLSSEMQDLAVALARGEGSRRPPYKHDYDTMYTLMTDKINRSEPNLAAHGSLIRYVFCQLLGSRLSTLMEVSLPPYMLECRSLLENLSDFIQPSYLADTSLGENAEERMLRVLRFYVAGLCGMRGVENVVRQPLPSVRGEVFRCYWEATNVTGGKVRLAPRSSYGGRPEPYLLRGIAQEEEELDSTVENSGRLSSSQSTSSTSSDTDFGSELYSVSATTGSEVESSAEKEGSGSTDSEQPSWLRSEKTSHDYRGFTAQGLLGEARPEHVRFLAEQISGHPVISAFYADCRKTQVRLEGTVTTEARITYGCLSHLIRKVKVAMRGKVSIMLEEHGEEYCFTFPSMTVSHAVSTPTLDFGGYVRIVCAQTGYQCVLKFPPPDDGDRFRLVAKLYCIRTHGVRPICNITGKWNGVMRIDREGGERDIFFSKNRVPRDVRYVMQVNTREQKWYESQRLWREVVRALVAKDWEAADENREKIEQKARERPMGIKYFSLSLDPIDQSDANLIFKLNKKGHEEGEEAEARHYTDA